MIRRLMTLLWHWREAKSAFSTLGYLYSGTAHDLDALGGLTDEEMSAVCRWATERPGMTVVEVGTLFGLTARALAARVAGGRVIAVDNFSWNPFGLPARVHESFTRRILAGSSVELWNVDSASFREKAKTLGAIDMVFFDASHVYEDVKAECEWAKRAGVGMICGHDYGNPNPRFGVTRAVDEVFGRENVEVVGMCWRVKA